MSEVPEPPGSVTWPAQWLRRTTPSTSPPSSPQATTGMTHETEEDRRSRLTTQPQGVGHGASVGSSARGSYPLCSAPGEVAHVTETACPISSSGRSAVATKDLPPRGCGALVTDIRRSPPLVLLAQVALRSKLGSLGDMTSQMAAGRPGAKPAPASGGAARCPSACDDPHHEVIQQISSPTTHRYRIAEHE
jgi:hypothetical protein